MTNAIVDILDILSATTPANEGTVSAQTGASTVTTGYAETGEVVSVNTETWHVPGVISIPALPNQTTNNIDAAQALVFRRGDQSIAFSFRDTRTELLGGKLEAGETALIASNSKARVIIKKDDSIQRITSDSDGNMVTDELSPDGWKLLGSFGSISMNKTGFHVITNTGAAFHLGGTPNPMSPTYGNITASNVTLDAATVMLGASASNPLGWQSETITSLGAAIASACASAATAAASSIIKGPDNGAAAFAAFGTTVATAITALVAQVLVGNTISSSGVYTQ